MGPKIDSLGQTTFWLTRFDELIIYVISFSRIYRMTEEVYFPLKYQHPYMIEFWNSNNSIKKEINEVIALDKWQPLSLLTRILEKAMLPYWWCNHSNNFVGQGYIQCKFQLHNMLEKWDIWKELPFPYETWSLNCR